MARVLIGNFKGPKGDKGDIGEGKTGPAGAAGQRGSRWSEGTAITGTNTTATVFSGTGIADALANDMYMNTSTGNVYRCTVGGAAAVAKWVFAGNLKGTKGDKGNTGAKGATGLKALQPNRRWTSTFTTVGATASAPFTDFNRNPVVGDVFMNADGSSNIGQWKVTAISGTTATFQLISYVSAKGAKGDTGASGTADTTFMEASALTKLTSGEPFKTMLGKLAKAVSSVFDKLDKSKVVNNQVTTETGYALDARQANPNIDGTLAKQVADLNGSLFKGECIFLVSLTNKGVWTLFEVQNLSQFKQIQILFRDINVSELASNLASYASFKDCNSEIRVFQARYGIVDNNDIAQAHYVDDTHVAVYLGTGGNSNQAVLVGWK